ncbi:MAG: acyl carrier protein [Solirubrobacterales bacterium]
MTGRTQGGAPGKGDTEGRLLAFIVEELLEEPFRGDDPLAVGAVDSLGIEQLLGYIEETFGVELDEEEIVYDNFESLAALAALVDSKC